MNKFSCQPCLGGYLGLDTFLFYFQWLLVCCCKYLKLLVKKAGQNAPIRQKCTFCTLDRIPHLLPGMSFNYGYKKNSFVYCGDLIC